jgi:hypothetical protein
LSDEAREPFELEVLRPPTFEQLAKRLRAAKAKGVPFHAVHFDGHGLSGEIFFENRVGVRRIDVGSVRYARFISFHVGRSERH